MLVAAIPLLAIGLHQHDVWSHRRPVWLTPRAHGVTVGWSMTF
jgi:hypothetical protein